MEQDILNEFYYGRIVPWENRNDRTPEMEPFSDQVDQDIIYLEGLPDGEGKKVLERRMVCKGFKDGFRLGVQLVTAAAGGNSHKIHKFRPESLCNICSGLTCYYPLLERICVLPKGKTQRPEGRKRRISA